MADAHIVEQDFVAGLSVVQIEDLRVARGLTRRPVSSCEHLALVYDNRERRVWCKDCETDIDAFDAFVAIVERFDAHAKRLNRREQNVREAEAFTVRMRATKVMDEAWRSRNTIPCCPHCKQGIFPEDIIHGISMVGREYASRLTLKKK